MPHVRTQLRNAIKTRLETVSGIRAAYNLSRLNRDFQSHNFPLALVNLTETVTQSAGSFPGEQPQTRSYRVDIQLGAVEDGDDPESALDDLAVDIEKALIRPDFGIGRVTNWRLIGASVGESVELKCGLIGSQILTYSGDLQTLDSAPDQNLHS